MKTLGLIGGTTWVSTVDYYRLINQQVNAKLGGLSSAKLFMYSVNFEEFRPPDNVNDWGGVINTLITASQKLETAGSDCIVFCANTPHLVADTVQEKINIPIIHIAEETAKEIDKSGMKKVGLLGTKFTMEQPFYHNKLSKHGITAIIPGGMERPFIHNCILDEFAKDIFKEDTKAKFLEIIDDLKNRGAEGVIFGCTEIPVLIKKEDCPIPSFDTTLIHVTAAVNFALSDDLP